MRIAILGATSQIAKDLIVSLATGREDQLYLFARHPDVAKQWSVSMGLSACCLIAHFSEFNRYAYDAIINFVGVGNPAEALRLGNSIFDITAQFDDLAMGYLHSHPECRYLFLSSGAAYGSRFEAPVTQDTPAVFPINQMSSQDWYGAAKLYAECRHRAHPELAIIDIRVFNYFSHTQDTSARFLIMDMIRAIRHKTLLNVSPEYIVRDYLHPSDFYNLLRVLLLAATTNVAVDCYTQAPIDKPNLLAAMVEKFGLCYEMTETNNSVNATGGKPHYYSLNTRAGDFGYVPLLSSLQGVLKEMEILLSL